MNHRSLSIILLIYLLSEAANAQTKLIPFNHKAIRYEGRIGKQKDAAELSWSGTTVTIYFKGTQMAAILQDLDTANYYNVIIDEKLTLKIDNKWHGHEQNHNDPVGSENLIIMLCVKQRVFWNCQLSTHHNCVNPASE